MDGGAGRARHPASERATKTAARRLPGEPATPRAVPSERDFVVATAAVVGVAEATTATATAAARRTLVARPGTLGAARTATTAAARQDDVVRDDLGLVPLVAVLVVVARGAKTTFDENAGTLGEDFREGFAALAPHDHA